MSLQLAYEVCPYCKVRHRIELSTDGVGRMVESPLPCGCRELRAAGLCIECEAEVEGRAWRCGSCLEVQARRSAERYRRNNPDRLKASQRRSDQKHRDQRRARDRARWRAMTPEQRARRNERRRELAVKNPGRKAEYAKRYKARHPERVQEQQRRANARRAAEKREYMHRYATKYVGEGKAPVCRSCGGDVEWSGRGRPRLDCTTCRPASSRERAA